MQELYTTEYLLERLYSELPSNSTKKKFKIEKPDVTNLNRKTYIKNYGDIISKMNCDEEHFKNYIKKELNTDISVNENGMLVFDSIRNIELIKQSIASYVKKFILCGEPCCGSGDTEIIKENRIIFLYCKSCNSKKSISDIY